MRDVPDKMRQIWRSEDKTGPDRRPIVRATIHRVNLQKFGYDTKHAEGGDWDTTPQRHRQGDFASIIFGDESKPIELRNIKSLTWTRSLDQDVATATLTMLNVDLSPIGNADEVQDDDFDQPGRFTPNRGDEDTVFPWGYPEDGWRNLIVPDRMVKTYEGYGSNAGVPAAMDENLIQSGMWLIDKVTLTSTGELDVEMRDVGRMLLTTICFPPAVPFAEYPLSWSKIDSVEVPHRDATGGSWEFCDGTASSSNDLYIGEGLTNDPFPNYVSPTGGVNGHRAAHALTGGDDGAYWESTGQPRARSRVWWEVDFDSPEHIAGVRIDPKGGSYRIYISVKTADGWLGRKEIDYDPTKGAGDIDIGADIPFVHTVRSDRQEPFDVILPRAYRNVRKLRLTFTNLNDNRIGEYRFSARLNDIKIYTANNYDDLGFARGTINKTVGNYRDYTDIVKWVCAWAGWFWPGDHDRSFWKVSATEKEYVDFVYKDRVLPKGRVWGDFMKAFTAGEADLTVDLFDKKPLMDIINYVRDLLGFVFWVDEVGGIIWRMPNLWKAGNYIQSDQHEGRYRQRRPGDYVTLADDGQLINITTTYDSENLRERIFVANVTGKIGTVIKGFNPTYEGFRRVAGWTDQHFETEREVRIMADMIAAQQMFSYRRSKVTCPGFPRIQIDDQVIIRDRVTNDAYYHYVLGITSTLDMSEGSWEYVIDTHWLGENQEDAWTVDVTRLDGATQNYLALLTGDTPGDDR